MISSLLRHSTYLIPVIRISRSFITGLPRLPVDVQIIICLCVFGGGGGDEFLVSL